MSQSEDSDPLGSAFEDRGPTREFLFAQALEECLVAERRTPGSADAIIADQPEWARPDLLNLVRVARALSASGGDAIMSDAYRAAARERLILAVGGSPADIVDLASVRLSLLPSTSRGARRGRRGLLLRSSAGLFAAVLGIMATVSASASALPGEPLYSVKQAQEELAVRFAADDQARALALLRSADARLDETNRLLRLGRTSDAARSTQRYDQDVQRATTTFIVTIEDAGGQPPATTPIETHLSQQQERLQSMLQSAPEVARADLHDALVATERVRALVADPRPVEQALGRGSAVEPGTSTTVSAAVAVESSFVAAVPTHEPVVAGIAVERAPQQRTIALVAADRSAPPAVEPPALLEEHTTELAVSPHPEIDDDHAPAHALAPEKPRVAESAPRGVTPPVVADISPPAMLRERSMPQEVVPVSHIAPVREQDDDAPAPRRVVDDSGPRAPVASQGERGNASSAPVVVSTSNESVSTRSENRSPTTRASDSAEVSRPPNQASAPPQASLQTAQPQPQPQRTAVAVAQPNTAPASQSTQRHAETSSESPSRASTNSSNPTRNDSSGNSQPDRPTSTRPNRNQGD